ncbi:hypothetical protein DPMN_158434 [Dreissena polymorpha]|uniref:Uncharacterized protein n=1 Tax=Dreissena polymorpha TaxID=45954 RepID=A0A9D4EMA8_DREPO|nr:hypothetical protein DPMN_158434 [Dreissena polymorpha]
MCHNDDMQLKLCFTVINPALNPVCSSASSYSTLLFNRLGMNLGWLMRLMMWLCSHSLRLPFLSNEMTRDWVHLLGHFFSSGKVP